MKIRAHHLLCMLHFQGKGYSPEFVKNFYEILKKLQKNPTITLINKCDAICSSCPHNTDNACTKEQFFRNKDMAVINILKLQPDQKINFFDLHKKVLKNIKELKKVCDGCEWQTFCQEITTNFFDS